MDRLTERNKHGVAMMRLDLPAGGEGLVARLAAYEDTNLTPDEIIALKEGRDEAAAQSKRNCKTCRNNTGMISERCTGCIEITTCTYHNNWEPHGPRDEETLQ